MATAAVTAATAVGDEGRVSRTYLINIAAGRRALLPSVAAILQRAYPKVAAKHWHRWMMETGAAAAAYRAAQKQAASGESVAA